MNSLFNIRVLSHGIICPISSKSPSHSVILTHVSYAIQEEILIEDDMILLRRLLHHYFFSLSCNEDFNTTRLTLNIHINSRHTLKRCQGLSPPEVSTSVFPPGSFPPRVFHPWGDTSPRGCSGLQLASLALRLGTLVGTGSRQRHFSYRRV